MKRNLIALAIGVAVGYVFAGNLKAFPGLMAWNNYLNSNG